MVPINTAVDDIPMSTLVGWLDEARGVKPSRIFPSGRTCERWGCITRLSIYNPGPTCFAHTHDEFRPLISSVA